MREKSSNSTIKLVVTFPGNPHQSRRNAPQARGQGILRDVVCTNHAHTPRRSLEPRVGRPRDAAATASVAPWMMAHVPLGSMRTASACFARQCSRRWSCCCASRPPARTRRRGARLSRSTAALAGRAATAGRAVARRLEGSAQEHVRIVDRAAADDTASARRERRRDERVCHEPEAQEYALNVFRLSRRRRCQRLAAGAPEGYAPEAPVEAAARISADARL